MEQFYFELTSFFNSYAIIILTFIILILAYEPQSHKTDIQVRT